MIKIVKGILIIIPIILSGFLAFNIYEYNNKLLEKENAEKELTKKQEIATNSSNEKYEYEINLNKLNEEKKDKITECEKWIKWEEEIKEKIN